MEINETIDNLLEQHDETELFALVLERKRKTAHAKAKANSTTVGITLDEANGIRLKLSPGVPSARTRKALADWITSL